MNVIEFVWRVMALWWTSFNRILNLTFKQCWLIVYFQVELPVYMWHWIKQWRIVNFQSKERREGCLRGIKPGLVLLRAKEKVEKGFSLCKQDNRRPLVQPCLCGYITKVTKLKRTATEKKFQKKRGWQKYTGAFMPHTHCKYIRKWCKKNLNQEKDQKECKWTKGLRTIVPGLNQRNVSQLWLTATCAPPCKRGWTDWTLMQWKTEPTQRSKKECKWTRGICPQVSLEVWLTAAQQQFEMRQILILILILFLI